MLDISYFLGPDILLNTLQNYDMQQIVHFWGESIPMCSFKVNIVRVLNGTLRTLVESSILPFDLWTILFVGIINVYERPYNSKVRDEELQAMHEEEKNSMEFDNTFSKLEYSGFDNNDDMKTFLLVDIGKLIMTQIASWSQSHPGMLSKAVEYLSPYQQKNFALYQQKYDVQFS